MPNQLEEKLRIIKNQKEEYERQSREAKKANDMQRLYDLSQKIRILETEESKILDEINRQ